MPGVVGTIDAFGLLHAFYPLDALGAVGFVRPLRPLGAVGPVVAARGDALAAVRVLHDATVGAELDAHPVAGGIHAANADPVETELGGELLRERGALRRGEIAEIDVLDARPQRAVRLPHDADVGRSAQRHLALDA